MTSLHFALTAECVKFAFSAAFYFILIGGSMYQSQKDKLKLILFIIALVTTLIIGVIGIFFANFGKYLQKSDIETIGFILMGVGLGGFFLIIITLVICSIIKEKMTK